MLDIPTVNTERGTVGVLQCSDHPLEVRSSDLFFERTWFRNRTDCSLWTKRFHAIWTKYCFINLMYIELAVLAEDIGTSL